MISIDLSEMNSIHKMNQNSDIVPDDANQLIILYLTKDNWVIFTGSRNSCSRY